MPAKIYLWLRNRTFMKKLFLLALIALVSCKGEKQQNQEPVQRERTTYTQVRAEPLLQDSISIRAIQMMGSAVAFAGSKGVYGLFTEGQGSVRYSQQEYQGSLPEFRAVASTTNDFFMLSAGSPALLYKTGDSGKMELVYQETHQKAFYNSMIFWNDQEGIAVGDAVEDCLSIIITRDGGNTWNKLDCSKLPQTIEGEVAFAASNSNIALEGEHTWIVTGGSVSRVHYSPDKGQSWEVFDTPLIQGEPTQGGYSIDFYDENHGIIFGGDYTKPEGNTGNKAVTSDGGRTWQLVSDGEGPGYKSSVVYVPNAGGQEILATGFTGIAYSKDAGKTWEEISQEGFYTLRFANDTLAYAGSATGLTRLILN